jgi:hypothetical protein
MEVFMIRSVFLLATIFLIGSSFCSSQITQLWESPSATGASLVYSIGTLNNIVYCSTYDYSAKTITLYDATTLSQSFSITNSDTSSLYVVIPDVNGNGYPEGIMGGYQKNITIRDLKTGTTIYTFSPPSGFTYSYLSAGTTTGSNVLKIFIRKQNSSNGTYTILVYSLGVTLSTSVNTVPNDMPATLTLEQNYPNPFNPSTVIKYIINSPENVRITIYNSAGQSVREIVNGAQNIGEHSITWDGKDNSGMSLSSGVYFYQIYAGQYSQARKMVLLK